MIRTLRDSNISVKDIKKLMNDMKLEIYEEALKVSYRSVMDEINRLKKLRDEIENKRESIKQYKGELKEFKVKEINERLIYNIKTMDYEMQYSIKEIYDDYIKLNLDLKDIYRKADYYILREENITYGMINQNLKCDSDSVSFPSGKYLCYSFYVTYDDDYNREIKEMMNYIESKKYSVESELLLIVDPNTLFLGDQYHAAELQIKINI